LPFAFWHVYTSFGSLLCNACIHVAVHYECLW
jgi:hypothetical protein